MWAGGDAYEPYVGRWSRRVARVFLDWVAAPAGSAWLDVGCGTGALSQIIVEHSAPQVVVGIDPSDAYISYARAHLVDSRARFQVGSAQSLPFAAESFDVAVSGLVLNFVPEP